jgi:hypothetical protein
MEDMPSADLRAMVEAVRPAPDLPGGMTLAAQRQAFLEKSRQEIEKQRRDDPAGAVGKSPAVAEALRQYDPQHPETFRSVANARVAAQETLGIPVEYRSPITKDEALQMTAPLRRILPGQERDKVSEVVDRFDKMFGPDWPQAFTYAMGVHGESQAVKEAAAGVIRKYLKGQPVAPGEARQADQRDEVDAAQQAVTATKPRPTFSWDQPANRPSTAPWNQKPGNKGEGEGKQQIVPPSDDIMALRRNPSLSPRFDQKYGLGTAKKILDSYPSLGKQPPAAPGASGAK